MSRARTKNDITHTNTSQSQIPITKYEMTTKEAPKKPKAKTKKKPREMLFADDTHCYMDEAV